MSSRVQWMRLLSEQIPFISNAVSVGFCGIGSVSSLLTISITAYADLFWSSTCFCKRSMHWPSLCAAQRFPRLLNNNTVAKGSSDKGKGHFCMFAVLRAIRKRGPRSVSEPQGSRVGPHETMIFIYTRHIPFFFFFPPKDTYTSSSMICFSKYIISVFIAAGLLLLWSAFCGFPSSSSNNNNGGTEQVPMGAAPDKATAVTFEPSLPPFTDEWLRLLEKFYNILGGQRNASSACAVQLPEFNCPPYYHADDDDPLRTAQRLRPHVSGTFRRKRERMIIQRFKQDIKAVIALGDSITAGFGMLSGLTRSKEDTWNRNGEQTASS